MRIALYCCPGSGRRARYLADALSQGFKEHKIKTQIHNRFRDVDGDIAIAYGWVHKPVFEAYRAAGKPFVYFDLGYWNRRPRGNPLDGHYRMAINAWDTATTMRRGCPADRFAALDIKVEKPRFDGLEILIAAMSVKSAKIHGFGFLQWETDIQARIKAMNLPFIVKVRAKPNKKSRASETLEEAFGKSRIVLTRHSNVAVDALVSGIPFYAERGVASLLSPKALTAEFIENPEFCSQADRNQLLYDIAYAQWTPPEMRSGAAWEQIRSLICE